MEGELAFVDAAQQFDACYGDGWCLERLEAEHRSQPGFHATMILLDQVVIRHDWGRRHRQSVRADLLAVFSGDRDRGVGST